MRKTDRLDPEAAQEIMTAFTRLLQENRLQAGELEIAKTVCQEFRDHPSLARQIEAFSAAADAITDGLWTASMQGWCATKH